jgi:hypothetical protein
MLCNSGCLLTRCEPGTGMARARLDFRMADT